MGDESRPDDALLRSVASGGDAILLEPQSNDMAAEGAGQDRSDPGVFIDVVGPPRP